MTERLVFPDDRCRIAVLTPAGRGAIATVLVTGPSASDVVANYFHAVLQTAQQQSDRIFFGHWKCDGDDDGEELVVRYIGPDRVEIHCHGGLMATERITRSLQALDCQLVDPFDVGFDPIQDSIARGALIMLAQAHTTRTAGILLDQFHGALRRAFDLIRQSALQNDRNAVGTHLRQLADQIELGRHLTNPWRIVLSGAPNVGKSTLLNALLGFTRAIVHHEPGTTRDIVSELSVIDGWPVLLSDTAGLRATTDDLEQQGIERANREIQRADLILFVLDASDSTSQPLGTSLPGSRQLLVWNKIDLVDFSSREDLQGICVSATSGRGIPQLLVEISRQLVPNPPGPNSPIPFHSRHVEMITESLVASKQGDLRRVIELIDAMKSA